MHCYIVANEGIVTSYSTSAFLHAERRMQFYILTIECILTSECILRWDTQSTTTPSSRMPGNHIHGNGLPATFVPGRWNVCEGFWAVDESLKKINSFSFPLLLKRKRYFTNPSCLPHWQRKTSPRSTALVSRSVCRAKGVNGEVDGSGRP